MEGLRARCPAAMTAPADVAGDDRPVGRIVAVGNLKGGTGKSTLAVNLACKLAAWHDAVLLVDADPQGTASAWLDAGRSPETPSSLTVEGPGDQPLDRAWADRLHGLRERYQRIVIDMPPQFGSGFDAMLELVDAIVVPVTPSAIDLRATGTTLQQIQRFKRQRAGRPACLLVPNKVDQRTAFGRNIRAELGGLGWEVGPVVAQRSQQATAFAARRWIGAHAPGTAAAREIAVVATELDRLLAACAPVDYQSAATEPSAVRDVTRSLRATVAARETAPEPARRAGFLAVLVARLRRVGRPAAS